jgi:hypothetical protein
MVAQVVQRCREVRVELCRVGRRQSPADPDRLLSSRQPLLRFGFAIEYTDSATNLRYYEPDFVVVDRDDVHYVIETKGREDTDVAFKDRAATIWCENTTLLTGIPWRYVKVLQVEFGKLQAVSLSDVCLAFGATG